MQDVFVLFEKLYKTCAFPNWTGPMDHRSLWAISSTNWVSFLSCQPIYGIGRYAERKPGFRTVAATQVHSSSREILKKKKAAAEKGTEEQSAPCPWSPRAPPECAPPCFRPPHRPRPARARPSPTRSVRIGPLSRRRRAGEAAEVRVSGCAQPGWSPPASPWASAPPNLRSLLLFNF